MTKSEKHVLLSVTLASVIVSQVLLCCQTELHKEFLYGYMMHLASVVLFHSPTIFFRNKRRSAWAPDDTPTLISICHYEEIDVWTNQL